MIESLRVRGFLVFLFFAFCVIYLLPNVVKLPPGYWLYSKPLNYGLDIQGGAHLVYGVDVKGVIAERVERMARGLREELKEQGVEAASVTPNVGDGIISIQFKSDAERAKASAWLKDRYATTLQTLTDSGSTIDLRFYDTVIETYRSQVVNQAIEVIRNRVDEFGVAEPVIAAQGKDRILVQLPGITDPVRAKELINKTARLDFRLVAEEVQPADLNKWIADAEKAQDFALGKNGMSYAAYLKKINEALTGKLPANSMVAFEKDRNAKTMEAGKIAMVLKTDTDVSGDQLEDASVGQGEFGEPTVNFRFGTEGKRKFADLTGNNVGKRLAIVLDGVIYSAPSIRSRIDGQGQITLGGNNFDETFKEAQLISTALRAGALPATLQQLEERSVGPSLGQDSITKGRRAGLIGVMLVMIFMSLYYRAFGMVSAVTLGLNMVGLLAVLAALGATLTLPGIAGITLTVGMAVDANVIIYERIKEELARGVTIKAAVRAGFGHAFSAIFDSNVTTAIAAIVLIYFGSGPVRGFGVTLLAGIATTMITAVFVTRFLLDVLTLKAKPSKIWI